MKYDEIILRDLMNIYEKRDANSSNFKKRIKIKLNKKEYPKYFEDVSGYDEAIERLISNGFIEVKLMPYDTIIDQILLNTEKVKDIKMLLDIKGISHKRDILLEELNKYQDEKILEIKKTIEERISNNKSIKQYLTDNFIDSIKAIHYIENLDHDVYERNASNYIYNDSKKLSKLKSTLNSIYDSENIFLERGIISVPPYLCLKGEGIIIINNERIDLSKLKTSIGIPIDDLNAVSFENIYTVTTIENLTTFYNYESSGLIIYLGGFSTRSQKLLLSKLKDINVSFYHFGDIDYGGFLILNDLMEYLDLYVEAIHMDLKTLKDNIKFTQKVDSENYIDKLKSLLNKPRLKCHYDTIKYLIDNEIWLEQESFYNCDSSK